MGEKPADVTDPSAYARHIETYLCRKNGGHLIRVVGPAFDLVCRWAASGVPLKVAFRGIDRCCERHQRVRNRRRPVRIEFCEADVLDAFDDWRRALGVSSPASDDDERRSSRKPALAAHVERAIARLAHVRGVGPATHQLDRDIEGIIRALEEIVVLAARARGDARAALIARLSALDAELIRSAIRQLDAGRAAALRQEAAGELTPFRSRMPEEAQHRALEAAFARLVRESAGLPVLGYE